MKFSQKGFGLVEGLLVVITLTLIVGVGFYIADTTKDNDTSTKVSKTTPASDTKSSKEQTITFEFDALKVAVPKDSMKGLLYTDDTPSSTRTTYEVTNQAFKDLAAQCGQTVPTGALGVFAGPGQFPGQGNEGFNNILKQFDTGYVAYGDGLYGSVDCSDTVYDQLSTIQQEIADKLTAAFANAKEIQ